MVDRRPHVALMLGPYRNLTTLTAAVLALHPRCQVLNHAGDRIYADPRLNFLVRPRSSTMTRFIDHAVAWSAVGGRGQTGGSITHAHAFDDTHPLAALYRDRYGELLVKDDIRCLVWKESLRTSLQLRRPDVDIGAVMAAFPDLRFVVPVRNPLDCAVSNVKTGHVRLFPGLTRKSSVEDALDAILDELEWTVALAERWPGRVHHLFEHESDVNGLNRLAIFLGLPSDARWRTDASTAYLNSSRYVHADARWDRLEEQAFRRFSGVWRRRVLRFAELRELTGHAAR